MPLRGRAFGIASCEAQRAAARGADDAADTACDGRVKLGEHLSTSRFKRTVVSSLNGSTAKRSGNRMRFMYVVTTGTDDPTKASLPLHLAANGSVEVGHDTSVLLAGDATELLFGDNLAQMQGIGVPPVRELMTKLRDHAVPVYV
jgi:hypothetical protein